ncbi:hypothetical protein QE152_g8627 [Popillia japonica]|uniref:Uncharacterized protein n=1 Tax=Popillia japonica TaxID=7064 RepID=A0AAW1M2T2_POPJA
MDTALPNSPRWKSKDVTGQWTKRLIGGLTRWINSASSSFECVRLEKGGLTRWINSASSSFECVRLEKLRDVTYTRVGVTLTPGTLIVKMIEKIPIWETIHARQDHDTERIGWENKTTDGYSSSKQS